MDEIEKAFFRRVGSEKKSKILLFFIENRGLGYSVKDIAEMCGMSRTTVHMIFRDFLILNEYIIPVQGRGIAKLYELNQDNSFMKAYIEVYDSVIYEILSKESGVNKELAGECLIVKDNKQVNIC